CALDAFAPAWELLEAEQLPVLIDRPEIEWTELATLAARQRNLPIVVSWIGYRELRRLAPLLHRHPNLHLDTVNFSTHQGFDWFVAEFGAERLLFATGAPRRDPGESIAQLAWSGLSAAQMNLVARANAQRLFRLPAAEPERATPPVAASDVRAAAEQRRPLRRRVIDAHAHAGPYSLFHIPESDPASMV